MVNNNWIYFKKQKWDQKTKMEQQQRNFIRAFDSLSRNGNNKSAAYIRGILRSVAFPMLNNVAHTSSSNGVLLKKLFIYGFIRYNQNYSDLEHFTTSEVEKFAESDGISRIRNCNTFAYNVNFDKEIRNLNKTERQILNSYLQNAGLSSLAG